MKSADVYSGEFKYWATYTAILVTLIFISVITVNRAKTNRIQEFQESFSADVRFLAKHVKVELQGDDYESIDPFLREWVELHSDEVIQLRVSAQNGYELINILRESDSKHRMNISETIAYSYFNSALLECTGDFSIIYYRMQFYYWLVGILLLILTPGLAFIFQLTLKKRRISFLLQHNSNSLNKVIMELSRALQIIKASSITAFVWRNEPEWPIDWVSENVEVLTGYKAEDFMTGEINYASLIYPEDKQRVKEENLEFNEHHKSDRPSHKIYRIRTKEGSEKWVEDRSIIIRDSEGKVTHYNGVVIDISDRIRSEEKLVDSEQRFRSILEQTTDALFIQTLDGQMIETNRAACEELGYTSNELRSMQFSDIIEDYKKTELQNGNLERLRKGETVAIESKLKRKNGSMYPAEISLGLIQLNKKDVILGFARDLTERLGAEKKRLRAEQVYRTLFNSAPDPILIHDGKRILDANPALIAAIGAKTKEDLLSKAPLSFVHPDDHERAIERASVILKTKKIPEPAEFRIQTASGEERIALATPVPIVYDEKEAIMVNYHDITERKNNERELRKMALVVQQSPASIVITDPQGNIEYVNPKFEELTGFSLEDSLGKNPNMLKAGDYPDGYYNELWTTIRSGKTWTGDFRNKKKNGDLYWESAQICPILDESNTISHFLAIKEDITDRKRAEELTRDLGHIIEDSLDEIYLYDGESMRFIYVNRGAQANIGYTRDELMKLTPIDIKPLYDLSNFKNRLKSLVDGSEKYLKFETVHRRKDGSEYPVGVNLQLTSYMGKSCYLAMVRDITERMASEEKRLILEAQLRQSQKLEAVGTMAGGIAHDFNNILQVHSLYTGIIKDQFPEEEQFQDNLQHVVEAGNRAKELVKQILTFSRKEDAELKPTKIQYLIKDALKMTRSTTPSSIEVKDNIDTKCGSVLCDVTQLHQVFVNLCNNAVYAMKDGGGTLTVSLQETESEIENELGELISGESGVLALVVGDTGQGMSAETLEHIFDPFFTTKGVGEGTGLGLSIVHGIIKDMQSQIKVESTPGKGTVFTILMPMSARDEENGTAVLETNRRGEGGRILFVDDDSKISGAGKLILEQAGYEVTLAGNGQEALALFEQDPEAYDLIVTDLTMPKMNGLELGEAVRDLSEDIFILLTSGNLDPELQTAFQEYGFNGFIRKPWSADDILKVINSFDLKRTKEERQQDG